jgi:hypothetical protein
LSLRLGIIGGTSKIGISIVRELASSDFELITFTRNILKAKLVLPNSISLMEGDLQDKFSLENFCSNVDIVLLNLSANWSEEENSFHAESQGLKNFLEIANRKKIKKIYFVSSLFGNLQGLSKSDWWVLKIEQDAIKLVKSSGIPYSIFYTSIFMEFFLEIPKMGNTIYLSGNSDKKYFFVSASDFGKMLKVSVQQNHSENKEYFIQGLEAFSFSEATKIFIQNYKTKKLKLVKLPRLVLNLFGLLDTRWKYFVKFLQNFDMYSEKFQSEESQIELGKPSTRLQNFSKLA